MRDNNLLTDNRQIEKEKLNNDIDCCTIDVNGYCFSRKYDIVHNLSSIVKFALIHEIEIMVEVMDRK